MKKKLLALFLVVFVCLCFVCACSCSDESGDGDDATSSTQGSVPTTAPTTKPSTTDSSMPGTSDSSGSGEGTKDSTDKIEDELEGSTGSSNNGPTDATTAPSQGTNNSDQGTSDPSQGTTDPSQDTTDPSQGTTDPSQGTTDTTKPPEPKTIYVSFKVGGGTVVTGDISVTLKAGETLTYVPEVTRDGYIFKGWSYSAVKRDYWESAHVFEDDTNLYAIWEKEAASDPGDDNPSIEPDPSITPVGTVAPVIQYVRIANIGVSNLTIKFNAKGKNLSYEIRYSQSPITAENFSAATLADVTVTGAGEVKTAILDLAVGAETKYYIAVQTTANGVKSDIETVRAGGIDKVYIDPNRVTSIFCGEVIKDLRPLIDEGELSGDPLYTVPSNLPSNRLGKFYYHKDDIDSRGDKYGVTHERYGTDLAPIIDLEYNHYIDCVMIYYGDTTYDVDVRASKGFANFDSPEEWDGQNVSIPASSLKKNAWNKVEIKAEVRFIQVQFQDGEAPVEVLIYGYQTSETEGDELGDTEHQLPTVGDMMGACGLLGDGAMNTIEEYACVSVIREYHNLGWSYNSSSFPLKATSLRRTNVGNFDEKYKKYSPYNLFVPCLQWSDGDNPAKTYNRLTGKLNSEVASFTEKYLPSTYIGYADVMYQYAARYGSSKMGYLYENVRRHSDGGDEIGLNYIKWLEYGNEPNGEDQRGTTPYQLAALTSAAYDGHMRTLLADVYNPDDYTYFLGAKNADPDIKVAMAGLAGIGDRYIASMCYWMRSNREDIRGTWTSKNDTIAMDAFNVHTYFGEYYILNGQEVYVGVCPEEYGLVNAMSALLEFRDKYYPGVEVWLTEFGWDTNESYETMTSSHRYGEYSSRQVQAMWLTRAYILLSSCGVDKATMYMMNDLGNDRDTYGKYGTCGIFGYTFLNGNDDPALVYTIGGKDCYRGPDTSEGKAQYFYIETDEYAGSSAEIKMTAKPSFYYMSTLYNTLKDFTFRRELKSGNDDVWVYQYSDKSTNEAYALWCPTANMTKVDGYKLFVGTGYTNVVLTETDVSYDEAGNVSQGSITGKQTFLEVDDKGYVTVNVSENPVYVTVIK